MTSRMEWTDEAAAAETRKGDRNAFRVLVDRHSRAVFRLAYRMTGNEQDAEDVVQESFLRAYKQLNKFDERASFGTWLYRIAMNCSLDLVRSRKRRNEQMAPVDAEIDDPVLTLPSHDPTPDRMAMLRTVQQSPELTERYFAVAAGGMSVDELYDEDLHSRLELDAV